MKRISKEIQVALVSLMESGKVGEAIQLGLALGLNDGGMFDVVAALREVEKASPNQTLVKMQEAKTAISLQTEEKSPTHLTIEEAAAAASLKGNTYDDAYSKITMKMISSMGYGEEVKLNEKYYLYHYCEDDYIGLRHVDFEHEDIYTVQYAILEDDGKGNCTYDIVMSVEDEEIVELLDKAEAAL
jgi:hypothetical protein